MMNDDCLEGSSLSSSAAKSAIEASSDKSLRVPCYCEENVWRLAYRKIHQHQQQQQETQKKKIKKNAATTSSAYCSSSSSEYHVVFISNPKGCAPLFQQIAASDRDSAVFWDYHVILLEENSIITTIDDDYDGDNNNINNNSNKNSDDDQNVTEGNTTTNVLTKTTLVWDVDSYLPFPCHLEDYIDMVFPNNLDWPKKYAPYFRVIDASIYLRHFSSDRSHMYNSETKTWNEPPPSYDCILQQHENQHSNDSGSSNDDGNNNATYNSTTTTTTTTFKQYMTISNDVVDYQQQNGENKDNDGSNNKNESDDNNHKPIFGRVYSISRLVKRFGCSENNNNNGT